MRAGEMLAVMGAGAYGFVLSSNYNSRPRPAEVLVCGDKFRVIRRREEFRDLVRGEEARPFPPNRIGNKASARRPAPG